MRSGRIFDIKRYALHDGNGIRTTVFFKGCPLRCSWCHNPEGLDSALELSYSRLLCLLCGRCVAACPKKALKKNTDGIIRLPSCDLCGKCTELCPSNALTICGYDIKAKELLAILLADEVFYQSSQGGVSFSGGEALYQKDFLLEVLKACKLNLLHTTLETSLAVPKKDVESVMPYVDKWIVDIKFIDGKLHQKHCGLDNTIILDNIKFLSTHKNDVLIRIPLIPRLTATKENIKAIAGFLQQLSYKPQVELLNYNPLTESKYPWLNKQYKLKGCKPLTKEEIKKLEAFLDVIQIATIS